MKDDGGGWRDGWQDNLGETGTPEELGEWVWAGSTRLGAEEEAGPEKARVSLKRAGFIT